LEDDGLVTVGKTRGARVRAQAPIRYRERSARVHRRRLNGYSFGATDPNEPKWVDHHRPPITAKPIPDGPAEILGVEPGALVLRRRRVTSPEGEPPFGLTDSWILPEVVAAAPGVTQKGQPGEYLDHIEAAGHGPLSWYEIHGARMPTKEEAGLLDMPMRIPVNEVIRVAVSAATSRPVEVSVIVMPSDRVRHVVHLKRDETARYEVLSRPGRLPSPKEL
jgi:GntR family transcriptional regulator